jgi:hypothetical protein
MTKTNIERTEERKNRFTGESIKLTKEEATKHEHWDTMREHLNWFRQNNAEAYMVLLD